MSAFGCMYFQDPSFLAYQRRLESKYQSSNIKTLFDVKRIPKETQLRDILDEIPTHQFTDIFSDLFERLRRHNHLKQFELLSGVYLCSIDGTQHHSSKQVNCEHCLHKQHRNGSITYSHSVLQGAIMHPSQRQVIPLMPEMIRNEDGHKKQDCETNAAKRFIGQLRATHPRLRLMICGDGLFSHQPMIEEALAQGMHFLYVAKPDDHTYMMEWIAAYKDIPSVEFKDEKGRTHRYQWQNQVPLHGGEKAITVNYLAYQLINSKKKVTYKNSWVTDVEVTQDNIEQLVSGGRCRWKIENECFNTLKNQGYHITHNFGHGKKHLSDNMYILTLLAFYFHQIFELTDGMYQACRERYGSKAHMWENFRVTVRFLLFDDWEGLMENLLSDPDITEESYYRP
ncbi:hypothetical protein C7Y69_04615 [Alteromonas sp. KS69]|jgi:hypothetical protein|nr:hypothetical protein C7Y69_04615 [Alteromonas sp. KS69]|tara:strand:+ start:2796 stop:3986 length:1191 start_codon:yes stop_codon:yes gene_type:complete